MKAGDIIQEIPFLGSRYARILGDDLDESEILEMRDKFGYIHICSYKPLNLPGFNLQEKKTPLIDLLQSEERIFAGFNDTARKHIRRAERNGDMKIISCDKDIKSSYKLYKKVKLKEGARPDIRRDFTNCIFFNAYLNGRLVVTMSFFGNGKYLRAHHLASLRKEMGEDSNIAAQASRKLIWEVCKYAKAAGYKKFDNGIINFSDPGKKGIGDFKLSMGGDIADVYIYRHETGYFSFIRSLLRPFNRNIL